MTKMSRPMTITDQRGAYGRKRKCAKRFREAKRMPVTRAQPAPLSSAAPVTATQTPSTRWIQPQPVRLIR